MATQTLATGADRPGHLQTGVFGTDDQRLSGPQCDDRVLLFLRQRLPILRQPLPILRLRLRHIVFSVLKTLKR